MIEIIPLTFRDCCFVAANIRDQDWEECRCQLLRDNKFDLGNMCFFGTEDGLKWAATIGGQPVAAFGFVRTAPCLYQIWLFGTRRMSRAFPAILRFLDGSARKQLMRLGARRVEMRVMAKHQFGRHESWIEKTGADFDCPLEEFGKNGETFYLYSWTRNTHHDKPFRRGNNRLRPVDVVLPLAVGDRIRLERDGSVLFIGNGEQLPLFDEQPSSPSDGASEVSSPG